ncbi:hypothetical protein PILCRDRAFT_443716 [Piloderma croceum F 1598]|uniref:Uncharacterized protein n=1 Tax=Piloderma croceum (strain F 1598) TaxID=765440 RepID=A0A0C3C1E9_PILCF|nr:hypothetical protein PILCRDRAFT_443716 [Piloderma croceum F 1598]
MLILFYHAESTACEGAFTLPADSGQLRVRHGPHTDLRLFFWSRICLALTCDRHPNGAAAGRPHTIPTVCDLIQENTSF